MNQRTKTGWRGISDPRWLKYAVVAVGMFATTPYGPMVTEVTNKIFLLWGALLILADTLKGRVWVKSTASLVWLAALAFGALTVLTHPNMGANIASWACNAVLFAVFFAIDRDRPEADVRREIRTMSHIVLAMGVWIITVSLIKGIFQINTPVLGAYQGMVAHENRLWGWCSNANGLGQVSWITIMASAVAAALCARRAARFWYILPAVLGFCALALSDSRSCLISLIVFGGIAVFFVGADRLLKAGKGALLRIVAGIVAAAAVGAALYGANLAVQAAYPAVSSWATADSTDELLEGLSGQTDVAPPAAPAQPGVIGRDKKLDTQLSRLELSSGRFYLWQIGLQIVKENLVLGVGQANVYDACVSQGSTDPRSHLHNGYLQTAVADGLVGFVLLILLGISVLICWIAALKRRWRIGAPGNGLFYLLVAMGVSVAANNLFESSFYDSLGMVTGIFWIYLGYSLYYARTGGKTGIWSVRGAWTRAKRCLTAGRGQKEQAK